MILKNISWFYLFIFLPMAILVTLACYNQINPIFFALLMMIYAFIYHPTISRIRLLAIGTIRKKDFTKTYIPFWNSKYFTQLFFNGKYDIPKSAFIMPGGNAFPTPS
ncbi:MAG: hypothetical protein E6Q66_06700 [Pedobacter sp.]|nr:MAG: hypothetical protein E6Q66_06700 [Pedobacter sp.]